MLAVLETPSCARGNDAGLRNGCCCQQPPDSTSYCRLDLTGKERKEVKQLQRELQAKDKEVQVRTMPVSAAAGVSCAISVPARQFEQAVLTWILASRGASTQELRTTVSEKERNVQGLEYVLTTYEGDIRVGRLCPARVLEPAGSATRLMCCSRVALAKFPDHS